MKSITTITVGLLCLLCWHNSFAQGADEYQEIPLEEFQKMSDYGYYFTGNLNYRKPSYDEGSGYGNSEGRYKWRQLQPGRNLSSMSRLKLEISNISNNSKATGNISLTGEAGPENDFARFTYNHYLDSEFMDKPLFIVGEPQFKYDNGWNQQGKKPETNVAIYAGAGIGKLYPSAKYDRTNKFLKILHDNNLLSRKLNKEEMHRLMDILINNWDSADETYKALRELRDMGLLTADPDIVIITALKDVIDKSYHYKESGEEIKLGIHYEFVKEEIYYDDDPPINIALSYIRTFFYKDFTIQPRASIFEQVSPTSVLYINAGADIEKVVSAELRHYAMETFAYSKYEDYKYWSNNLTLGSIYELVRHLNASLEFNLEHSKETKPDLSIMLSIGIGSPSF
ncbi:MAG: hypothetical protein HQ591_10490 [candidate division Zixibacteria bacterium]|nr:hypothetical protein [Candidatus Tariuqbacter arcticus]